MVINEKRLKKAVLPPGKQPVYLLIFDEPRGLPSRRHNGLGFFYTKYCARIMPLCHYETLR